MKQIYYFFVSSFQHDPCEYVSNKIGDKNFNCQSIVDLYQYPLLLTLTHYK